MILQCNEINGYWGSHALFVVNETLIP